MTEIIATKATPSTHILREGELAPLFQLPNQNQELVSLRSYRDKNWVILYFYPKAQTPGCTTQARDLRDGLEKLEDFNAVVLGMSPDDPEKLKKFEVKESLNFHLLSDLNHQVAESYGVWGRKKFLGKQYDGIFRTTFIIGKDGKIKSVIENVKAKAHFKDILTRFETL